MLTLVHYLLQDLGSAPRFKPPPNMALFYKKQIPLALYLTSASISIQQKRYTQERNANRNGICMIFFRLNSLRGILGKVLRHYLKLSSLL